MPVKRKIPYSEGVFFITFTCYQWLSLIEITKGYDLVYKWFDFLKGRGDYIIGYQIMPNHVHTIIAFINSGTDINKIIGNGKRYMAYGIVKRLKGSNQQYILIKLQTGVNRSDRKRGKIHEVWEDSFDWKDCRSRKMILQKLTYMHNNACRGKWQLAQNPVDYSHSSAKFYITGEQGIYPVTSYMMLDNINLTIRLNAQQQRH
jgi:REP element-mobilizing transposase RayT